MSVRLNLTKEISFVWIFILVGFSVREVQSFRDEGL